MGDGLHYEYKLAMIFYNTTKLVQISIFYYIDFFSFREQESPAEQSICQRIGFLIAKGNKTIVDSYRYFEYELIFINQYLKIVHLIVFD